MPIEEETGRGKRRFAKRSAKRAKEPVQWSVVDSRLILRLIESVASSGGAVRFGKSRDQGALSLGVYGDGDPYTEWFRDIEEFAGFAEELIRLFNGKADLNE